MNYEVELRKIILCELKNKFKIESGDELYKYLLLRNICIEGVKFPKKEDLGVNIEFMEFILKELYIEEYSYRGEKISFCDCLDNSMSEIVKAFRFRYSFKRIENEQNQITSFYNQIKSMWYAINTKAKRKTNNLNSAFKNKYLIFYRLKELNKIFNVTEINQVKMIKGFKYGENFYRQLPLEVELERYIVASKEWTSDLYHITEEEFEKYIYRNLDKIEDGLRPIQRQYEVEDGIIDILAKDKNNKLTIIELKIRSDKHLIWQVMYYPDALKDKMKIKDVRIITVCPFYPKYILAPLKKIGNVDMIVYSPFIERGLLKDIKCRKIL